MATDETTVSDVTETTTPTTTSTTTLAATLTSIAQTTEAYLSTAEPTKLTDTLAFKAGVGAAAGVVGIVLIIVIIYCVCRRSRNPGIVRMRRDTLSNLESIRRKFKGQSKRQSTLTNTDQNNGLSNSVTTFSEEPLPTPVAAPNVESPPAHVRGVLPDPRNIDNPGRSPRPRREQDSPNPVIELNEEDLPPPPAAHTRTRTVPGYIGMSSAKGSTQHNGKPRSDHPQTDSPRANANHDEKKRDNLKNRVIPQPPKTPEPAPKPHGVAGNVSRGYINTGTNKDQHNPEANLSEVDLPDYENKDAWMSSSQPNLQNNPLSVPPSADKSPQPYHKRPGPTSPKPKNLAHNMIGGSTPNVSATGRSSPQTSPRTPAPDEQYYGNVTSPNSKPPVTKVSSSLKQSVPVPESSPSTQKKAPEYYNLMKGSGYQNIASLQQQGLSQNAEGVPKY